MNYSQAKFLVRRFLGPLAQIRPHNGGFRIFVQTGDTRTVHGEGSTYAEAFVDMFEKDKPNGG